MDGQEPVVSENEHNYLEQIAGMIRSDRELLRWVTLGIEVDDDDC